MLKTIKVYHMEWFSIAVVILPDCVGPGLDIKKDSRSRQAMLLALPFGAMDALCMRSLSCRCFVSMAERRGRPCLCFMPIA